MPPATRPQSAWQTSACGPAYLVCLTCRYLTRSIAGMSIDAAIETHGLRKEFGEFVAVDGIDLLVPRGSFYGFLGPNGAGKSTTIKCLTGLLKPSAGRFRILDMDPLRMPVAVKRQVGVVPEDLALFDRLTGAETLAFVGRVHGIDA